MKMLPRAASDSRWTSATSAKRLSFKSWLMPGDKKKIPRSEVGRVGGGYNNHFVFSQKGGVLLMYQRLYENRWPPLTAFPFKILDNVYSSVRGAGSLHQTVGVVLWKGLKFQTLTNILNKFFNNTGNFCVPPHILSFQHTTSSISEFSIRYSIVL